MNISSLQITPELLRLIAEIDEFKGSWRAANNQSPERLQQLRRVATIESIGSSTRIEGAKLSNAEIEQLLSHVKEQSLLTRDEQEVAGYAELMEIIFENYPDIPFTENYVKQLHASLMRHSEKDEWHRGEYKKHPNSIEAFSAEGESLGVVFETTSPFDTPAEMQKLLSWVRDSLADKSYHPLIVVAVFNVVFLAIHPFQDGNGRLSRALISLLLLKAGYSYVPYSSLESVIERNKDAYYLALQRTQRTLEDTKVDWLAWVRFFLTSLKRQKDHLQTKTQQTNSFADLPYECVQILEYVEQHQRITVREAEAFITTIARPTIKNRFAQLVELGLLERKGKGRGVWYAKA